MLLARLGPSFWIVTTTSERYVFFSIPAPGRNFNAGNPPPPPPAPPPAPVPGVAAGAPAPAPVEGLGVACEVVFCPAASFRVPVWRPRMLIPKAAAARAAVPSTNKMTTAVGTLVLTLTAV